MRQHLGEQLEEIARFCRLQGKEAGYRLIIEVLTTAVRTAYRILRVYYTRYLQTP